MCCMCYPLRLKPICGTVDVINDSLFEMIRITYISDYFTFGYTATA